MTAPKTVIGGDDVRAIVADCGTWAIRIGSSGDDTPRSIIPSAIGHRHPPKDAMSDVDQPSKLGVPIAGDQLLTAPSLFRHIAPIHAVTSDAVTIDWDAMQLAWQAACTNLRLRTSDAPFLIVEPTLGWAQTDRAKALERAFEGLNVPAAYTARGSAMAAFASAKTTACVLDIGYQGASAIPVVDGYAIQKRVQRSVVGGLYLSERLMKWTEDILDTRQNYDGSERRAKRLRDSEIKRVDWLRAHHELKRERIMSDDPVRRYKVSDLSGSEPWRDCTSGHRQFYRLRLMDEVKMATFRVSAKRVDGDSNGNSGTDTAKGKPSDGSGEESKEKEKDKENNGKEPKEGKDKGKDKGPVERSSEYTLPDGNTLSLEENDGLEIANLLFTTKGDAGMTSVSELIFKSISGSDVDLRRDLFGGVVITGGTSMIPGVVERITRELALMIPQAYKLKVFAPPNSVERTCAAWIGGSIVSSLGTFQQAWVSKAEYDELGSTNALRKCP